MSKLAALLTLCALAAPLRAADEDADPKKLEATLEAAMTAYNKDDSKTFFKDYSKTMASIATEQAFNTLYKSMYKKDFGDYTPKSMKFRKEGSLLMGDFLVVYFDAEFAKEKGTVAANFVKEDGAYKVMQIQMQKPKK